MKSNNSIKLKFSLIIAFALSFLIAVGAFLGITLARADRTVSVSSSGGLSIFKDASNSNAPIWAHEEGEGDDAKDFVMFVFEDDDDAVNYKKNLAFKWYENIADNSVTSDNEDGEDEGETEEKAINFDMREGWFNMEIGFADQNNDGGNLQFEKFVITFESQQYSETKDGKTTNYIVFEKTAGNDLEVYVATKDASEKDLDAVLDRIAADGNSLGTVGNDHITIKFDGDKSGNYTVKIADGTNTLTGTFENIGKTYSKNSSSTTAPVTPLSFKALFAEEDEENPESHGYGFMTLYSLNNQSFELSGVTDHSAAITRGNINDDTPPVVCLDKAVPFIKYNGEITFDYTVIDVITSSPSLITSYYMLTAADANGNVPEYKENGGDFRTVSDSDDQYIFPSSIHYRPDSNDYGSVYNENFKVKAAVKVVLKLTDTTSTGGQTTYVYLDWYVDSNYLIKLNGDATKTYIAVASDEQGLSYAYTDVENKTSNPDNSTAWATAVENYKNAVAEAAKDLKAGSKNYFYLPSVENLFNTDATPYSDLTFSIYYNNGSQQQSTGKSANGLSINLTKAGKYVFTVYAKDAAGNNMLYFDDEHEETELEASEIWNMYKQEKDSEYEGMRKYLPWFEFTVEESEISIEDPDDQSTAYVGSSFTPDSFEINGVSVKTVYSLYEFQNDLWAKDNDGKAMTYEEFSAQKDTLLQEYRRYFTRIRPTSELKEGTADYEKFNEYGWNGSSLTFTPQTDNAFYLIKCEASSSETAEPVTQCMVVAAAPKVDPIKGEDTWVQDNVTSIILLCIAGASLIGIILLLVIKPKNNGDVDEVIKTSKKSRKKSD
ncbi:MAG: hypothetical protein K2O89_06095 [Clostridia bacterium]|nr:hypothetical protein [Clostridia bacterium]